MSDINTSLDIKHAAYSMRSCYNQSRPLYAYKVINLEKFGSLLTSTSLRVSKKVAWYLAWPTFRWLKVTLQR